MISWSEYFFFMLAAHGLYYGWWLLKYYSGLKRIKLPVIGRKRSDIAESKEPRTTASEKPVKEEQAEKAQPEKPDR